MAEASEQPTANAEMGRYWNEVAGPRWVGRQALQEARNVEMLAMLLEAAHAARGERVLDIGCGTGVTTEPFARAVSPGGQVTAVDISQPMLDAARRRMDERGITNVTLLLGDAQVYPLPPASFDLVTSRCGVMFFADPTAAFANLLKALKPGARLCMAVWATLDENTHWKIPYDIAVRRLGPPPISPAHAPGPHVFGDRAYLRGALTGGGFVDIAIEPRDFHIHCENAAVAAEHVGMFGAVQRLMDQKKASEAVRNAIIAETEVAFEEFAGKDGVRLPATFLLVSARRPN